MRYNNKENIFKKVHKTSGLIESLFLQPVQNEQLRLFDIRLSVKVHHVFLAVLRLECLFGLIVVFLHRQFILVFIFYVISCNFRYRWISTEPKRHL